MSRTVPRGTSNTNARGSAEERRKRRVWLLSPESDHGGDGESVPCYRCDTRVTYLTMEVDRIRPGVLHGRYIRDNIRPSCKRCNHETGTELREKIRKGEIRIMTLDSGKGNIVLWREGRAWNASAQIGGSVVAETVCTNRVDALAQLSVSLLEELIATPVACLEATS